MKRNQQVPILIATAFLSLTSWCTPNAFGSGSLVAIPTLEGDTSNEARAITPDGVFVVGLSGAAAGFLYNMTNGYLVQPVDPIVIGAKILTGVGYRTDTNQVPSVPQLIVSGLATNGAPNFFTAWMTPDGGTNWDYASQYSGGKKPTVPLANSLAGSAWDVFHCTWTDQGPAIGDNWQLYVGEFSGWWVTAGWDVKGVPKPNSFTQMNGISGNGRAVGWRQNSGAYITYIADYNGPDTAGSIWSCRGLDGTTSGQTYSVSADGTVIFGISPKSVATGATNYGFKATFNTAFPGAATQLSTNQLPNFSDATGATNTSDVISLAIPFGCTPDGKLAVGMTYRGREKAVLWDASDTDATKWTITDLTDLAKARGILGSFTNLSRAYSIGTDSYGQKVIAGMGVDATNNTRAFVMSVPPAVKITTTPQKYTFTIQSVTGRTYYLEFTPNVVPTSWSTLGSTPGTGNPVTLTDLNPTSPRRFYRVRIQ